MSEQIDIVDAPDAGRFEARIDGALAGFAEYADADGIRTFPHTEVDPAYGGRGVGSRLVDEALRATVAAGLRIRPLCSFVRARSAEGEFAAHVVR